MPNHTPHRTIVFLAGLLSWFVSIAGAEAPSSQPSRADWMQQARWGVFVHYIADTVGMRRQLSEEQFNKLVQDEKLPERLSEQQARFKLSVDEWNALVDSFDVQALARQLKEVGAGYFVITIGQNSGHYCSPNAVWDRLVGITPSKCSRRDLIADLYKALKPAGIRLMVYLPAGAPFCERTACEKLQWHDGAVRNREFQLNWEQIIAEWSKRWGEHVSGWWFDGCYWPDAMYRHSDPPNFQSFAAAARAGNPHAIVAFNPGVMTTPAGRECVQSYTPFEDYTAGEIGKPNEVECTGSRLDGEQWHMLSYLGKWWYWSGRPRFSDAQAADITARIVKSGGAVTWDVPMQANGTIPAPFIAQLRSIGSKIAGQTASQPNE